jgi:hypothetical protein
MSLEVAELSEEERQKLAASIDDLISDTPKTQLAVQRVKQMLPKLGVGAAGAMKELLVSVATEAVKKALGLG